MTNCNNCDDGCDDIFLSLHLEDAVPDMDLDIYNPTNDEVIKEKISDYAGKWLVLFFYPADFTFVCPTELKDLNKIYNDIKEANGELLVVSLDTVFSHKRWIETEGLLKGFNIKMVSDRKSDLSTIFGLVNSNSGNCERGTFIISPDGVLKSIEVVTEPIGRSTDELLRKLRALEFVRSNPGAACPSSWNVGLRTLKPSIKIAGHVDESLNS